MWPLSLKGWVELCHPLEWNKICEIIFLLWQGVVSLDKNLLCFPCKFFCCELSVVLLDFTNPVWNTKRKITLWNSSQKDNLDLIQWTAKLTQAVKRLSVVSALFVVSVLLLRDWKDEHLLLEGCMGQRFPLVNTTQELLISIYLLTSE